jgi:phage terminase small subunit
MKSTPEGLSVVDFSGLTRDETAALSQVTVEDIAGGKRVQFKLHDKRAAAPARIAYPGARCG